MTNPAGDLARLAALYKRLRNKLAPNPAQVSDEDVRLFFEQYNYSRGNLGRALPDLFFDLPVRSKPVTQTGFHKPYVLNPILEDLEFIFEVRANSELSAPIGTGDNNRPQRIFISHGRSNDWREVQAFIDKDLMLSTLELAQQPNQGRTILQKLFEESEKCSFAVVVMTGDDVLGADAPRVRENVMHEIGYFQGKYGLANVCLLHEEGVSVPTNIHGVVYIPFPKGLVSASFGVLMRELRVIFPQ